MQHNTCKEIFRYEKSTVKSGILHGERQYSRIYFEFKCNGFYISKNTGFLISKYIKKEKNNYKEIVKKLGCYLDNKN